MAKRSSRRQFIRDSALVVGAGVSLPLLRNLVSGTNASAAAAQPIDLPGFAPPGTMKVKYYGRFSELPVGSVKPLGWVKSWLERQATGLTGHPENMGYPYDTCMYAGKIPPPPVHHGQGWWPYEQAGYFVDAAVRLSHLIESRDAKRIPSANLQYILANPGPGRIGQSTWGWPNAVVGRALMAEHSATGNAKVAQTLCTCVLGNRTYTYRDGVLAEEAFYLYGLSGDPRLLAVAQRVHKLFFVDDPKSTVQMSKIRSDEELHDHGVTAAEKLKLLPLMYCYTGDKESLEMADRAFSKVEGDSLMADGCFVSAEHLATTAFNSLHETCDITDWAWTLGYMLMASGDPHWADRIEQMTFNALPGVLTKDFKQVQYFSSANQVLCSDTACDVFAVTRMSYRAAHETECCAGNVNRAMPNYVTRMWMRMSDGIAATLFGPGEVTFDVDGQPVTITEETDYPFRETITFTIKSARAATFTLGLRIPGWCDSATVTVNGAPAQVAAKSGTFAQLNREFRSGDVVTLKLPMVVRLKKWFSGGAVSVERGPLVYAMQVAERRVESQRDSNAIRAVLKGNQIQGFPAVEFFPAGEWRFGLDGTHEDILAALKVIEGPMTENPFTAEAPPVRIELPMKHLPQWQADWRPVVDPPPSDLQLAVKNPTALPDPAGRQPTGDSQTMVLLPYGATHLRLTTLPLIKA